MKILVACEESQTICKAFRARGHEAYSADIVEPVATWCPSGSYSQKHGEQYKGMFTKDRAKNRSKTFEGIAEAMAEQWGVLA